MIAELFVFISLVMILLRLFSQGAGNRQLGRAPVYLDQRRPAWLHASKELYPNPVWAHVVRPTAVKAAATSRFSTYLTKGQPL
jgi:hypothetical protein